MDTSSSRSSANAPDRRSSDPVEFYLPGTFQFGHGPGRIERFLGRVSGTQDDAARPVAGSAGSGFYLPATPDVESATSR